MTGGSCAGAGENFVVTIDGLSGSGKSTVARVVAERLGALHLNSGLLYRAVGCEAENKGVALDDEEAIRGLAQKMSFRFAIDADGRSVLLVDGELPKWDLSSGYSGELASRVAIHPSLREVLNEIQRASRDRYNLVLEGRDAGSVVFPKAKFKFFLSASLQERARRRYLQLLESCPHLDIDTVREELWRRDNRDTSRECAPSLMTDDAIEIQTEERGISDIVDEILGRVRASF